jgi:hypothetical protein
MPPVTVRPADGGQLITRAASSDAGVPHYTKKLNARRDLSDDIRREGWDYFNPLPGALDEQTFPFPGPDGKPLTLVHLVRRPNGESVIIAGNKNTLYRFNTDLAGYIADGYIADGYFEEPTRWQKIGDNFSDNGKRWEAKDIEGTTIFNNADDLPMAYRVEWRYARPLYELRELGIVCFGTIGEINSVLMGGDVTELRDQDRDEVLNVIRSGTIRAFQAGYQSSGSIYATSDGTNVTASSAVFSAFDVGRTLVWFDNQRQQITAYVSPTQVTVAAGTAVPLGLTFAITDTTSSLEIKSNAAFFTPEMVGKMVAWADGSVRKITQYLSPTLVRTDVDVPVSAGEVFVENPITYLSKSALEAHWQAKSPPISLQFDRRQFRVLWGEEAAPERYGILINSKFSGGSKVILVDRMNQSIEQGETVGVTGAGVEQGVLFSQLTSVGPGIMVMADPALNTGSGGVYRKSSTGSIAGYDDLQGDGAGLLKMLMLQSRIVIYSDSHIFLGRFTGNVDRPFEFEIIKVEHGRALHYRNTLVSLQNTAHIFAGRTQFYSFDLTTRQPTPIEAFDLLSNLFYDYAAISDTESIYAADNELTQELWFVCPANAANPVLAYDYVYKTFSTIDFPFTCAATVKDAVNPLVAETSDCFLMGTAAGTLLVYGLTGKSNPAWSAKSYWYRRDVRPYSATPQSYWTKIASGMSHFGDAFNEKHFSNYVLQFSSLQGLSPTVSVNFYTALNESGPETLFGTVTIADADAHGLIPLHSVSHMMKDEVYTNVAYPVRFHSRTWEYYAVKSKSHHKK